MVACSFYLGNYKELEKLKNVIGEKQMLEDWELDYEEPEDPDCLDDGGEPDYGYMDDEGYEE